MTSSPTGAAGTLAGRVIEMVVSFLPLSISAFGGPPAHIALLRDTFVVRKQWLDDTLFSEFFAVSQALPGPGSTEMLFSIAIHRGGLVPAVVAFFCWSLPGLVIMTGLGLGVSELPNPLPMWLTQFSNGISAAAVGLVAQAATALSRNNVTDKNTLFVCTVAAAAAVLYSASWLEPVIIAGGGLATLVLLYATAKWVARKQGARKSTVGDEVVMDVETGGTAVGLEETPTAAANGESSEALVQPPASHSNLPFSWPTGIAVIIVWVAILIPCIALKSTVEDIRPLAVLMQFYVAGCIIFGGGPVVIPLLYSYVVNPGWVSERDFLLGVALIQAMPGPNFNFAAYCGALALAPWGSAASIGGALLGYAGIFTPGLAINAASLPLWQKIRTNTTIQRALPGMNAAAVGLVFAAAFLLFRRAIVRGNSAESLSEYPYYAVVAACSYVLVNARMRPWIVMILGALAGLVGWGLDV
ncbi:hypothetical protein PhCBS80983_g01092 [Powellomyces hirtus]|uniref:Chromate transporter n=1 Tax=Powellomyces hirtus TaxID=109895 RepID=A0A507EBN9_9FUNG|nr:hypothetical protein PhCBS80983_g01092 [Powellomyces hirtus]